jgi:hypothetical protein
MSRHGPVPPDLAGAAPLILDPVILTQRFPHQSARSVLRPGKLSPLVRSCPRRSVACFLIWPRVRNAPFFRPVVAFEGTSVTSDKWLFVEENRMICAPIQADHQATN